jgi:hypothetical protein
MDQSAFPFFPQRKINLKLRKISSEIQDKK